MVSEYIAQTTSQGSDVDQELAEDAVEFVSETALTSVQDIPLDSVV